MISVSFLRSDPDANFKSLILDPSSVEVDECIDFMSVRKWNTMKAFLSVDPNFEVLTEVELKICSAAF